MCVQWCLCMQWSLRIPVCASICVRALFVLYAPLEIMTVAGGAFLSIGNGAMGSISGVTFVATGCTFAGNIVTGNEGTMCASRHLL